MHLQPITTYSKQAPRRLHAMFLGLIARSGRTCLVCRSLQLGADDDRCVALASKWLVLWVDEIGYSVGGRARYGLRLTLSNSIIQYLLALGSREGYFKYIPVANYSSDTGRKWRLSFVFFFRLDMVKFSGVTTN